MHEVIAKLRKFHKKQRFALDVDLSSCTDAECDDRLHELASDLARLASGVEHACSTIKDVRLHRAQLLVEEVGEVIEALSNHDEEKLVDGLADTQFVTVGTSETFGLPTRNALVEVCDSNLTKNQRSDADYRLRSKGPDYRPPDVKRILAEWHDHRDACQACSHAISYPKCHSACPHNLANREGVV